MFTDILTSSLLLSSALLVSAAPTAGRENQKYNTPLCGNLPDKVQGWNKERAPWMKSDATDWPFCASRWNEGRRIVGIAAYKEDWYGNCDGRGAITRLEVRYDDQQQVVIGTENKACPAGSIGIAGDEFFSEIIAQRAGDRTDAAGKITVKTQQGGKDKQAVWLKDEYTPGVDQWKQDVKSGMLVGISGYMVSDALTSINFQFLPAKVKSIDRSNMVFDPNVLKKISADKGSIEMLTSATDCNPTNSSSDYTLVNTKTIQTTLTTTNQHQVNAGVEISATAGVSVPGLAKFEVTQKVSFSYQYTHSDAYAKQSTTSAAWTKKITEKPGYIYDCVMQTGKISGDIPYTATMTVNFEDGWAPYTYQESGAVTGDIFANNAVSTCTEKAIDWKNPDHVAACSAGPQGSNAPLPGAVTSNT